MNTLDGSGREGDAPPEVPAAEVGAALSRLFGRLEEGDHEGFLGDIARLSVDDRRQLSAWFRGYRAGGLESVGWAVEDLGRDGEYLTARVAVLLRFTGYDPVSELFKFWLNREEDGCHLLGFEQTRQWGVCEARSEPAGAPLPWPLTMPSDYDPEIDALLEIAASAPDPEEAGVYARSVSPAMRTVEGSLHRKIAHLAANMMSGTTAAVAAAVRRSTPGESALNLHRLVSGLSSGFPPEVYGETAGHNLPWILSDEMAAFSSGRERPFSGTCQSLAELVTATMRLNGATVDQAFTVELYLHNAALHLGEPSLMFSNLALIPCGPRTMHWNRSVGAFWNDAMGWDHDDEIFRPAAVLMACRAAAARAPFLDFPVSTGLSDKGAGVRGTGARGDAVRAAGEEADPGARGVLPQEGFGSGPKAWSPAEMSLAVKRRVFALAAAAGRSPYAHARYALQTILVRRPEAYILRGGVAPALRKAADILRGVEEFITATAPGLGAGGIFPEAHRIMTPDQVFRHRTADEKAWALLVTSFCRAKGWPAAMVWTDEGWFALTGDGGRGSGLRVYRMTRSGPEPAPAVSGVVRLVAWAGGSVYPLLAAWSGDAPAVAGSWAEVVPDRAWREAAAAAGLGR